MQALILNSDIDMHHHNYQDLLDNNLVWIQEKLAEDGEYFDKLSQGQQPPFLFIGCSDSRMPLTNFTKTGPGELFIHRNIANQVSLTDMNLLAVLQFAVEALQVKHIVVCGHHCCGGIEAAYKGNTTGAVENWVNPIRELYLKNRQEIDELPTEQERVNRLSELNVVAQVENICKTSIMNHAFKSGVYPSVHGWVLEITTGRIKDLPLPLEEWRELGLMPS